MCITTLHLWYPLALYYVCVLSVLMIQIWWLILWHLEVPSIFVLASLWHPLLIVDLWCTISGTSCQLGVSHELLPYPIQHLGELYSHNFQLSRLSFPTQQLAEFGWWWRLIHLLFSHCNPHWIICGVFEYRRKCHMSDVHHQTKHHKWLHLTKPWEDKICTCPWCGPIFKTLYLHNHYWWCWCIAI